VKHHFLFLVRSLFGASLKYKFPFIVRYLFLLLLFVVFLLPQRLAAQSLPVGTPVLEDYYRRQQLLGHLDSTISFASRPLFINPESTSFSNGQNPSTGSGTGVRRLPVPEPVEGSNGRSTPVPESRSLSLSKGHEAILKHLDIRLLPIEWNQQYNTHHPYSLNDGAMIPARGYQTLVSAGVFIKAGPLTLQLRPEYVYAENKYFDGFGCGIGVSDQVWVNYYKFLNTIDLPERFGDKAYSRLSWGQSSIRLNFGAFSTGISNENLWWGPGMRNSLLMTNTSGGFMHLTFNTTRPIRTKIGSFEGQIIAGRLDGSGYLPPKPPVFTVVYLPYIPKKDDWRYINGMVLSYQPKWVPGLFVGLERTFMVYHEDMGNFPVISPVGKKNQTGGTENPSGGNQLRSVFGRYILPKEHAEIYFEYGRDDLSYNVRDFLLEPDYARAYIIGFRKLFLLNQLKERYIQFNMEITQLEQNTTNTQRSIPYFYTHPEVRHGYTNRGQLLGAGIGPGSDMQNMEVSWHQGLTSFGFQAERFVQNNNFHYLELKDVKMNWVDIAFALVGEYQYKNFLFSAKAEMIRSINYEHIYDPIPGSTEIYWQPGKDIYNYQFHLGVTYRL